MKRMWTESTSSLHRPRWAALKVPVDPMLFALACAMLAALLYSAGMFAIRIYSDDERYDISEAMPPAQPW